MRKVGTVLVVIAALIVSAWFAVGALSGPTPPPFGVSGSLGTPLRPGVTEAIDLVIANPNDTVLRVDSVDVTVHASAGGCADSNFSVQNFTGPVDVPPGATESLSQLGVAPSRWPQVAMTDVPAQDSCKASALALTYSGSGVVQEAITTTVPQPTTTAVSRPSTTTPVATTLTTSTTAPIAAEPPAVLTTTTTTSVVPATTSTTRVAVLGRALSAPATSPTTRPASNSPAAANPSSPAARSTEGSPLSPPGAFAVPSVFAEKPAPGGGTRFTLAVTDVPPTCTSVYFFFDSSRIGTASVKNRSASEDGLVVPGNASSGTHALSSSCSSSGKPALFTQHVQIQQGAVHLSALVTSIPSPSKIKLSAARAAKTLGLALPLILAIGISCEVFNVTFEENYSAFRRWFRLKGEAKDPFEMSKRRVRLGFAAFMLAGGLLYAIVDPGFGLTLNSAITTLCLTVTLLILTATYFSPYGVYMRVKHKEGGRPYTIFGSMGVAVVCVVISRILHFEPGFVYGILAGIRYRIELEEDQDGKLIAVAIFVTLLASLGAWVAFSALEGASGSSHPGVLIVMASTVVGYTFLFGLEWVTLALIPIKFMEGSYIFKWSKLVWGALFALTLFTFSTILLQPSSGYVSVGTKSSMPTLEIIAGAFVVATAALWTWFHFHPEEEDEEEEDEQDEAEVVLASR
jgi:hypothetical protein